MINYKKIFCTAFLFLTACIAVAQDKAVAGETVPAASSTNPNVVLLVCAGFLAIILIVMASALKASVGYHQHKTKNNRAAEIVAKSVLLLVALFSVGTTSAQETVAAAPAVSFTESDFLKWLLITVIVIEMSAIFLFTKWIKYFAGVEAFENEKRLLKKKAGINRWKTLWEKMNSFKPMEKEADIDTGHSYDGIRELDNVTPPWFKLAFALSIVFAIAYLWRYHVAASAPMQVQEYEIEVAEAKAAHEAYLKNQASNVDENTVKMLAGADIDAGAAVFKSNCVACHGDKAQGNVGPNLTDEYWLHGGNIRDIFKSIKYGWQDKGMKSWKDDFSPTQIAQLTSYIKSLKGSNPPGAKEAQGVQYTESPATDSAVVKTDSLKIASK
ncbi:MAG: cbb3-type cytochrome c oxidase N-terminal domain-containing protein [Ferruginibacter sp.]